MRRGACVLATGLGLLGVLGLFGVLPARAGGVVGTGTPGSCTAAALVSAMGGGGLVTFNCGAQPHTIIVTYTGGIIPAPHTTLDGGGLITLSGNHTDRLFWVGASANLTLTHLTLADGYMNHPGGAIRNEGRTVLDSVTIRNGLAVTSTWGGGGVYNLPGATLIVRDSTLHNNASAGGGAIYNEPGGHLLIEDSHFLTNTAYGVWGGAIHNGGVMTLTGGLLSGNVLTGPASLDYGGGALANVGTARATVTGGVFRQNTASAGGGAIFSAGVLTLTGSLLEANTGHYGGGLFKADHISATLTVMSTTLSGNWAYDGGGFFQDRGTVNVTNTTFTGNMTPDDGGGMFLLRGTLNLAGSLISGNEAADGGGIASDRANVNVFSSTVSGNSASGNGAGVWGIVDANLRLERSTVSGNTAGGLGGGLYSGAVGGSTTLINSTVSGNAAATGGGLYSNNTPRTYLWNVTVAGNSASTGGGLFTTAGITTVLTNTLVVNSPAGGDCAGPGVIVAQHSLASDATCALPPGNNQNSTDPMLTPLANFGGPTLVHLPKLGSPALNGVVGSNAPATDQRGEPRPQGGGYDIGAVERQPDDTELVWKLFLALVRR